MLPIIDLLAAPAVEKALSDAECALCRTGIIGVAAVTGGFIIYKGIKCIVESDKSVSIEGNFKGNSVSMKSEK